MFTGDAQVDQQHQELIRQMNLLINAMSEGKGREQTRDSLDFLAGYVREH